MPGQFPPYAFHPGITCKRQVAPGDVGQIIASQVGNALTQRHIVAEQSVEVFIGQIVRAIEPKSSSSK